MSFLDIKYQSVNVQISLGYNYQFPKLVRPTSESNAVDRRCTLGGWEANICSTATYIGETEDLARRITKYITPGKKQVTNLRLKAYFDNALKEDQLIELQTLKFEPFQINKVTFSMDLLGHAHVHRMLENLVLCCCTPTSPQGHP